MRDRLRRRSQGDSHQRNSWYGKCSKNSNTFLFLFAAKMLVIRAGIRPLVKSAYQNSNFYYFSNKTYVVVQGAQW